MADSKTTTKKEKKLTPAQERNQRSLSALPLPNPKECGAKGMEHFDVYFQLNDTAIWSTKDKSIDLSVFPREDESAVL